MHWMGAGDNNLQVFVESFLATADAYQWPVSGRDADIGSETAAGLVSELLMREWASAWRIIAGNLGAARWRWINGSLLGPGSCTT